MNTQELAVVVGATGSMGRVICRRLAEKGLKVIAVARSADAVNDLAASIQGVVPCIADIASDASVDAIRAAADGVVRVVVHGPGVPVAGGVTEAPVATVIEAVNLKAGGMLRVARAVDTKLIAGSRLIGIGGHYGAEPAAYAATASTSNAALASVIKQMAWGYGARGVTSHLIAPGPTDSERLQRMAATRATREGITKDQAIADMRKESAIGAFSSADQVAWAVEMLLAPEASALVGSGLAMDSGRRKSM